MNGSKHMNRLKVNNLIAMKSVAILEASERILGTQCVKSSVISNTYLS
jgi:hypothetical protein